MMRRLLPNAIAPVVVVAMLSTGNAILLEATLGFFGMGAQPPVPSWGGMMSTGSAQLFNAPLIHPLARRLRGRLGHLHQSVRAGRAEVPRRQGEDEKLMAPLLKVEDLRIGFGPLEPLAGVDVSVDRGRILGLVGRSGSGKSMTAMSIMGLLPLMGGASSPATSSSTAPILRPSATRPIGNCVAAGSR